LDPHEANLRRRFRFPRSRRLHLQRDFARIFARKCRLGDRWMTVYLDANGLGYTRLGLIVGKKVGKAVVRNRIKRLIREAFRLSQHELPAGLDVICIPRPGRIGTLQDYAGSLARLLVTGATRLQKPSPPEERADDGRDPTGGSDQP